MASFNNREIVFESNLSIDALVAAAYVELGDGGIVRSAVGHSCDECCHAFKDVADVIPRQPNDPAAVVGHDENHVVPDYEGPDLDPDAMQVDNNPAVVVEPAGPIGLANNAADVRMVVIDGIVMGPRHCAMEGCEKALLDAQTGVFCEEHEEAMEGKCRMKNCDEDKVGDTQACEEHQPQWAKFRRRYANSSLLGVQRMLRRAQEERQEWLPAGGGAEELEHDNLEEQENEEVSGTKYNNYFSAPRFYCVETLCAPCGVVIAWRKFAKAEGVAKILRFLEDIYPNTHSRPSYIAIDKGCALLKHIVRQGHWL
ncbi:CxC6 like cysteine cluster associated with KDZ domain-containing protein [Pleurotus pulmonarius]